MPSLVCRSIHWRWLRDAVVQVRLRVPRGDRIVKVRELGLGRFAVHRAEHGQRGPGLDGGPAARGVDDADGHVAGLVDPAREDVADGREFADRLGRAHVPVALAEVPAEPVAPLVQAGKALLEFRALAVGDGQDADLGEVRGDDFERAVLDFRELELHVALPAEHPDVTDEDVVENESLALAFDRHLLRVALRGHGGQRDFPRAVFAGLGRRLLAGERDRDLFARLGPAPDVDRLVPLEHHVGLEDVANAQPSPIAGTSTTSSRGIGCASTGSVRNPARVTVAIKRLG